MNNRYNENMEEWIRKTINEMTLQEKAGQLLHNADAIPRLGIQKYCWWNEALHGIAQGKGTVFPQAIGLAAAFDTDLMQRIGSAVASEARARHHHVVSERDSECYEGLTFWCPNINIFRDPRWGRGMETYGEDPYLTGEIGKAFVNGLQGDDPEKLKVSACAKHFAVHSGPEHNRHEFNAIASQQDMDETYLPAFKKLVEAGVSGIMGAYNRTNGEVCCGSNTLLHKLLREKWGFEGYIVSDCWAISDFHQFHKVTSTPVESVALALKNGCNLNCGVTYKYIIEALKEGLLEEADIDSALRYVLRIRYRLGMFSSEYPELYKKYPLSLINCEKHKKLSLEAAQKSIVLLENSENALPVNFRDVNSIFVTGPMAARIEALIGNYYGFSENFITILEGITQEAGNNIRLSYHSCSYPAGVWKSEPYGMLALSENSDVTIGVFGLDVTLEGEQGEAFESLDGDRLELGLPEVQMDLIKELRRRTKENGKKFILILTGGSPIILPDDCADAVLYAWYAGESGGKAVAEVLFGKISPSGRLPVTFPLSEDQLPPFDDYSMQNRTYRFMQDKGKYLFGYGLSYTKFECSDLVYELNGSVLKASFKLENSGSYDSEEVCMLFAVAENKKTKIIRRQLVWFKRVFLEKKRFAEINIEHDIEEFAYLLNGDYVLEFKFDIQGDF